MPMFSSFLSARLSARPIISLTCSGTAAAAASPASSCAADGLRGVGDAVPRHREKPAPSEARNVEEDVGGTGVVAASVGRQRRASEDERPIRADGAPKIVKVRGRVDDKLVPKLDKRLQAIVSLEHIHTPRREHVALRAGDHHVASNAHGRAQQIKDRRIVGFQDLTLRERVHPGIANEDVHDAGPSVQQRRAHDQGISVDADGASERRARSTWL
eukprot:scaffold5731_cov239-Pinguiococcus_pyrenoidosus.AAC.4